MSWGIPELFSSEMHLFEGLYGEIRQLLFRITGKCSLYLVEKSLLHLCTSNFQYALLPLLICHFNFDVDDCLVTKRRVLAIYC